MLAAALVPLVVLLWLTLKLLDSLSELQIARRAGQWCVGALALLALVAAPQFALGTSRFVAREAKLITVSFIESIQRIISPRNQQSSNRVAPTTGGGSALRRA